MRANKTRLKRADFTNIFKKGKTAYGRVAFLKFKKNNKGTCRFGVVVGLRVSKKAIIRNKIKRQIKEIVKGYFKNIKPEIDIIIVTKPLIVGERYKYIKEELEKLFKKLKPL